MKTCDLQDVCSGCPWISTPYETQLERKRETFATGWRNLGFGEVHFQILSAGFLGTRDRADLQLRKDRLGLYDLDRKEVVSIETCPAMSPKLAKWFDAFRGDLPDIEKGSVRLRIAPDGAHGVWLDFANEDVKRLFDERAWLSRLAEKAIVEVGQRKKRLSFQEEGHEGRPRLVEPKLHSWITTLVGEKETPLWTTIGSFTQPGNSVSHLLVKTVMNEVRALKHSQWMELGAGAGKFTLPLLAEGHEVTAVEIDALSVAGLKRSAAALSLDARLTVIEKSFENAGALPRVEAAMLVDPPRSGLGGFLQSPLLARAPALIYVSCWSESFFKDAVALKELGFQAKSATAVDLFPGTSHAEWVITFTKN